MDVFEIEFPRISVRGGFLPDFVKPAKSGPFRHPVVTNGVTNGVISVTFRVFSEIPLISSKCKVKPAGSVRCGKTLKLHENTRNTHVKTSVSRTEMSVFHDFSLIS